MSDWMSVAGQILSQKSLMVLRSSAVMRFAMEEASDDGAAQSRPRAAVISS
jgi:hypothetical protein